MSIRKFIHKIVVHIECTILKYSFATVTLLEYL